MYIDIDNIKVNYIEKGVQSNTKILLLHGWGASIESFQPVIDNLATKFKVYALDFPGFGNSQMPNENYTVEDYSKLVLEFINKLKLDNVVLVGHSFGGRVIIKLVGKLGYKPKKIILIDSAGIRPKRKLKYYIKVSIFKVAKSVARLFLGKEKAQKMIDKYQNKYGSLDYKNANETMKNVFKNVVNEDLTKYISNINASTLIVWGDRDTETPLSDGQKMEKLIKDSGLVILKGAGHFSYLNNLNEFLIVVNKYLEGCD